MRVMHLSDLHLGKVVLSQSMIEDQRYILNEIVAIVKDRKVDVVLIAGDVYDKPVPTIEAVHLFNDFLTELYRLEIKVLVISGNHDSRDRLIFGNELLMENGVYIEGFFQGQLKKVTFDDEYGKINFYMLPFVKPADVRHYYMSESIDSYHRAIEVIIRDTKINRNERNILMVHQFVTACGVEVERCDSETISLGGIDNVDVSLFDDFDYVAMGHIHGTQKLIRDTVRYGGSPLKYSFSEVSQKKGVTIVDFKEKGDIELEFVRLIPLRDMRVIKGPIDKLLDREVVGVGNCEDYISAVLTDEDYAVDALGKLRKIYKNLLRLEYQNARTLNWENDQDYVSGNIKKRSALELFEEFYRNQNNVELDEERQKIVIDIIQSVEEIS